MSTPFIPKSRGTIRTNRIELPHILESQTFGRLAASSI